MTHLAPKWAISGLGSSMFCTKVASRGGTPSYPKARTAEGVHIYAIGDMHGMVELAAGMFDKIDTDIADWSGKVIIIGLGDYIDRGPRSDSVIEFLIQRSRSKRSSLVVLRGNHEDILLRFLDDPEIFGSEWLQLGGEATLSSYGVRVSRIRSSHTAVRDELKRRMPVEHLAFLQALPLTFEHAELFFSHAGLGRAYHSLTRTKKICCGRVGDNRLSR